MLSASRLLERRRVFHNSLLSIVKQHHKVSCSSLGSLIFLISHTAVTFFVVVSNFCLNLLFFFPAGFPVLVGSPSVGSRRQTDPLASSL